MSESGLRVFISYRREDCAIHAGRLADNLGAQITGEVFLDVDSVPLGDDFAQFIEREVASCHVVIVMIGDDWLTVTDDGGEARIMDPLDWVHLEIKAALERAIPVIPVLVEGARMPRPHQLPEPLTALATRNAATLRDDSWRQDVEHLAAALNRVGGRSKPEVAPKTRARPASRQRVSNADTVIVAARFARGVYLRLGTYICQPRRSFRAEAKFLGFYADRQIDPVFPRIVERREAVTFTKANAQELRASGSERDRQVADIVEGALDAGDGHRTEGAEYQVFLLDEEAGFRLRAPVVHSGPNAWAQAQRYTSSEALKSEPQTTDELAERES